MEEIRSTKDYMPNKDSIIICEICGNSIKGNAEIERADGGRGEGLWRIRDCFGEFRFNVINLSTNLRMKQMSEGFPWRRDA